MQYWMDNKEVHYEDWKIVTVKLLPKKGDLTNPNNWRGITLLDITSKLVSILINNRLQWLIAKHGILYQFGATLKLGCQDAVFVLKSFL